MNEDEAARASPSTTTVTELLTLARSGDPSAADAAFAAVYDELRRLARARLRPHRAMTLLDTTSLVHECFLRMAGSNAVPIEDRRHFFAYAARVMRSVIVDFARARQAERRGGDAEHLALDTDLSDKVAAPEHDVLRVHEALDVLAKADARLAQVVELRYFGGLSEAEIATTLDISERTVRRDWEKARLLLLAALS
jgi:RNA polymerase sigma factor (TIGR02999 family)